MGKPKPVTFNRSEGSIVAALLAFVVPLLGECFIGPVPVTLRHREVVERFAQVVVKLFVCVEASADGWVRQGVGHSWVWL